MNQVDKLSLAVGILQLWEYIAVFEECEVIDWQNSNSIQQEARACARMEAYVKLFYIFLGETQ